MSTNLSRFASLSFHHNFVIGAIAIGLACELVTFDPSQALTKTLTERQKAFAEHLANGIEVKRALTLAGYSDADLNKEAQRLLQSPAILASVHIATARQLALGAPTALRVLREFIEDETCDKRIRFAAVRTWLDRSGHIAPKATAPGKGAEKPLNEMSTAELRELADKLENEIAGRAKPISSAAPAPKASQAIEDLI